MKNILAKANRSVLERFAWSQVALIFDFDGTLAPIVDSPADARMRGETVVLLRRAADRYPICVVSGRALRDVQMRMEGISLAALVGNHGAESAGGNDALGAPTDRWTALLAERLQGHQGVVVEDKGYSVAIHYRASRSKRAARSAIATAVNELGPDLRVFGGKHVVNVVSPDSPHKGLAVERILQQVGVDTAIYVGDDTTDEDVFCLQLPAGRLLGIRVGISSVSRAAYFVRDQRAVDMLLSVLVSIREHNERAEEQS